MIIINIFSRLIYHLIVMKDFLDQKYVHVK
jgi:hypothetical protein